MINRLIPLWIGAALTFSGPIAYANVSPAVETRQDLIDVMPKTLSEELNRSGFCDLSSFGATVGGQTFAPDAPWAGRQGQTPCVLPVPPRDIFEHIVSVL